MGWEYKASEDYLQQYFTDGKLDVPSMLNDDFLKAIKLLLNNRHYISGLKLLFSFIDTLAYIEFGDKKDNFVSFLDAYIDLKVLNVTSVEIWECRNSLLHMSSLESRKVKQGHIRRLIPHIGEDMPEFLVQLEPNTGYLNVHNLYLAVVYGLPKWLETYNITPNKWENFFHRYDEISSESRLSVLYPD